MKRGAWRATDPEVSKCQTWLSDYPTTTTTITNNYWNNNSSKGNCSKHGDIRGGFKPSTCQEMSRLLCLTLYGNLVSTIFFFFLFKSWKNRYGRSVCCLASHRRQMMELRVGVRTKPWTLFFTLLLFYFLLCIMFRIHVSFFFLIFDHNCWLWSLAIVQIWIIVFFLNAVYLL